MRCGCAKIASPSAARSETFLRKPVNRAGEVWREASRAILEAIIAGETAPDRLAQLKGQLKATPQELEAALRGRVTENHRFLLRLHLDQVDSIQHAIESIDRRLEQRIEPFRERVDRLTAIPGVSTVIARVIVAEVGLDMTRFATHHHLISWAGLCPRLDESAGKSRSRYIRKGNPWLKVDLTQAAMAARRAKNSICAHNSTVWPRVGASRRLSSLLRRRS